MPNVNSIANDLSGLIEETGSEKQAASAKVEVVWRKIRMRKEGQHEDHIHARSQRRCSALTVRKSPCRVSVRAIFLQDGA